MRALVGSLQYSPVFKSHCFALGKQLEGTGHQVKYVFGANYRWMLNSAESSKCVFIGKSRDWVSTIADSVNPKVRKEIRSALSQFKPDIVYMHNVHPSLNHCIALWSEKNGAHFIQHVHEPYVKDKSSYELAHRWMLYAFEKAQERILKHTDTAIVSSLEAKGLFEERYPAYEGKLVLIPLMYEDLGKKVIPKGTRQYVIFIGPPSSAKGRDTLLELIEYSSSHGLKWEFLMVSRDPRDTSMDKSDHLRVYAKDRITDDELGWLFSQSMATFAPYRTARQSSVAATSFMYGVPVLATDVGGLREAIKHERTGYLVNPGAPIEKWIEGLEYIELHFDVMSKQCRDTFTNVNSDQNWPSYFVTLFEGASDESA